MPVSHEYKVILVHIPKTGGTSIEAALGMHGDIKDVGIKPYKNQKRNYYNMFGKELQHLTIEQIMEMFSRLHFKSYLTFGQLKYLLDLVLSALSINANSEWKNRFENYYKLAVVRNPYDRIVSNYAWKSGQWHKKQEPNVNGFIDYVYRVLEMKHYEIYPHLLPQVKYLTIDGSICVDKVIHFEKLNTEFDELCRDIGVKLSLPRRMSSVRKPYEDYFNNEARDIVYDIYKKDFDMFGYKK